jgi:diguanylate cyclase (GGDEF)-like protein
MTRPATPSERRAAQLRHAAVACAVALGAAMLARWPAAEWAAVGVGLVLGALYWRQQTVVGRERERLRKAIDAMQAGIVLYDAEDRLLLANADFRRLYEVPGAPVETGMSFEAMLRSRVEAGLVPEALERKEEWITERLIQHHAEERTYLREMPGDRWRRITEQRLDDGSRLGFSIDVTDLVESRRALEAARHEAERAHRQLREAIESLPEGFALYDSEDRLQLCNERYRQLYRRSAPVLTIGATFESILRYGLEHGQYPQAGADFESWLAERLRRHRHPDGVPILQELPDNSWLRIDERLTLSGGVAGVRTDVTEMVRTRQALEASQRAAEAAGQALREANEQLAVLSVTDALTGVANRRLFDARLAEEVQRSQRHGTPLGLLLVDVDHFKAYNDCYGHPQGDRALQAIAAVLREQARRPGELVARYGGEEFALLLPHADAATAERVGQRCCESVAALELPHAASPTAAYLTLSVGCASLRAVPQEGGAALLIRADAALYGATAAGRARCLMSALRAN